MFSWDLFNMQGPFLEHFLHAVLLAAAEWVSQRSRTVQWKDCWRL